MNKSPLICIRNTILWILAIGYYFIIHSFSMTPAALSGAESQVVVDAVENIANVVQNKPKGESTTWFSGKAFYTIVRKTAHMVNFFILGFSLCMLSFVYSRNHMCTYMISLFLGLCGGALDEMTQYFVPGRCARILDVFIDFSGTIAGCIFFFLLYRTLVSKLKKRVML